MGGPLARYTERGLGMQVVLGKHPISVRRIGKSEQKCPIEEAAAVGMSRPCSQFLA
jgi:hypothetical protein